MSDNSYSLDDYVDDLRDITYAMHVDRVGRSQCDVEKNLEIPFKVVEQ